MRLAFFSCLILILATLFAKARPSQASPARMIAAFGATAICWLFLVHFLLPIDNLYRWSYAQRIVLFALNRLKQESDLSNKLVLIVEGSSQVSEGFDGERAERWLRARGLPAVVVQISVIGADHIERLELLRSFTARLTEQQKRQLKQTRVVFLREVENYYDWDPAFEFSRNPFADRVLAYSKPSMVPAAISWILTAEVRSDWLQRCGLACSFLEHVGYNCLGIGYFLRKPTPYPPLNGYRPDDKPDPQFVYEKFSQSSQPQGDLKAWEQRWSQVTWVRGRDDEFRSALGGLVTQELRFAVPSLDERQQAYVAWFKKRKTGIPFFAGNDEPLLQSLARPECWYNQLHLRKTGAEIYTDYFSQYLTTILSPPNRP